MSENKSLATNRRDVAAALARGTVGAIPIVGSLVAEIVDAVIPGRKLDRVVGFLDILAARLGRMQEKHAVLEQRLRSPEGSDLLGRSVAGLTSDI